MTTLPKANITSYLHMQDDMVCYSALKQKAREKAGRLNADLFLSLQPPKCSPSNLIPRSVTEHKLQSIYPPSLTPISNKSRRPSPPHFLPLTHPILTASITSRNSLGTCSASHTRKTSKLASDLHLPLLSSKSNPPFPAPQLWSRLPASVSPLSLPQSPVEHTDLFPSKLSSPTNFYISVPNSRRHFVRTQGTLWPYEQIA